MKTLFVLNLLLLIAALVLGDIVFGACALIGLNGFGLYVTNKRKTTSVNVALIH